MILIVKWFPASIDSLDATRACSPGTKLLAFFSSSLWSARLFRLDGPTNTESCVNKVSDMVLSLLPPKYGMCLREDLRVGDFGNGFTVPLKSGTVFVANILL